MQEQNRSDQMIASIAFSAGWIESPAEPDSRTDGAPEGVMKISISHSGAPASFQRCGSVGAELEMALITASLAAHRPAKLAAG
ncbi:hypothetical protein PsorP6_002325 [Peronosclerospora sorghi]|uniref:Uncharacterized protein n=1 Tax=Peronosclerospora sorghi TaxID=230839 RepID=A0ACC0WSM7_9STRA|nr:hypothetical protein PsorP6_002325 [Peronosclerospora sorghi]